MSKHTPGPWHIQSGRASKVLATKRGDDESFNIVVADCRRPMGSMSREEIHANAGLMAAAPEMLDILTHLARLNWDENPIEIWRSIGMARALIAKIESDP